MSALDALLQQIEDQSGLAWSDETYDLANASHLSAADRAVYVKRLMTSAQQGDSRAVLTLGHLHAVEALPMLRAEGAGKGPQALTARRALVILGHGAEYRDAIIDDALHAPDRMARVAAVNDLGTIGGAKAVAALEQALTDSDDAVRMIAWREIVKALDLERYMVSPAGILEKGSYLELLRDYLASDVQAFIKMGSDELRAIFKRLSAGESPAAVGIMYAADPAPDVSNAISKAIFDRDRDYPVDEIAKLTGIARRWSEAALALRAEDKDPRVPAALARLDATWTLPVLEELAASSTMPPEFRDQLKQAIRDLKAS